MSDKPTIAERLAIVRATGVPLSKADEERISASVAGSLKALDAAVPGSLFDTEPLHFERVMRELSEGGRK
ncbi:MAG TPA: hypothetical protein VFV47_04905 [Hyphomicrobiaceae bacterium]|jgi:hypothetical protein|nr:hypothetical protein [Hyphomicrobiaceae bacterium]